PASFAQARIWLDERIRFDPDKPQVAIYNMPFQYRLFPEQTLSIKRLVHALQLVVLKHQSLHTSLAFDKERKQVIQRIDHLNSDHKQMFSVIESIYGTDEQLTKIMHDEKRNPHLFHLDQGLVFRCHIIYYKQISSNHLLSHKDLLIFNFHHALFDFPSMKVFHHDLNQAYTTAPASFAQARIWLDERIRFDPDKPQIAIYNMPFVYRLQPDHTLSIEQLRHALHLTVNKHPSLHTSVIFNIEMNQLMQRVITPKDNSTDVLSIIETTYETDEQLNEILHDEKRNPQLFDLAQGLVFRCHIIYYKQISSNHLLSHKDLLIFNFHHALFDFPSMNIFLHDLNQAYTTGQLLYDNNTNLRYLDCK
ncbi:unnamed protein product, partial [Adineta steineri]